MALTAVALGSNLSSPAGDRAATLQSAVRTLAAFGNIVAVSTFFETEPVGYLEQPRFLNGAALLRTGLSPADLLQALMAIEAEHGRVRNGIAKGPRTLDLDLLLYDDVVLAAPELTLPHPEMHRRIFVLKPLAEIAPDLWHPAEHATVAELLQRLRESSRVY